MLHPNTETLTPEHLVVWQDLVNQTGDFDSPEAVAYWKTCIASYTGQSEDRHKVVSHASGETTNEMREADVDQDLEDAPTYHTFPLELREAARYFTHHNFAVFPVQLTTVVKKGEVKLDKTPMTTHGVKDSTTDPNVILDMLRRRKDAPGLAIGVDCEKSGIFVLDVDVRNDAKGMESLAALEEQYGSFPRTWVSRTPSGGLHYWFRGHGRNSVSSAALGPNLDTRGDGGYIVVPPSIADSGEAYTWVHSPDSVALADTPEWLIALTAKAAEKEQTSRDASDDEVIEEGSRNDTLFKRASHLRSLGLSQDEIFGALMVINATHCAPPLEESEVYQIAASAMRYLPNEDKIRHTRVNHTLDALGEALRQSQHAPRVHSGGRDAEIAFDVATYERDTRGTSEQKSTTDNPSVLHGEFHLYQLDNDELNDTGNARRLIDANKGDLLYIPEMGWGAWDHNRTIWLVDGGKNKPARDYVIRLATDTADLPLSGVKPTKGLDESEKEAVEAMNDQMRRWVRNSKNAPNLNRTLARAASENDVLFDYHRLNANPYLFQAANCVIDLRTGEAREGRREDYITVASPVVYDEQATCPQFLDFLSTTCDGNEAKMEYLLWMFGYSLVGHNRNALIFFFIGKGRDGKSTVMRVNREMLGNSMALLTDSSLLQLSTNPKHARNELASFQNKHLIVFSESASLARLDEDVVKRFTGENVIRGEAKFQDAVDIPVVGHGVLLSQHKPNIYDQSRAMWERLRLIQFNHEYTRDVRNPNFYEDVLAAELPGVLRLSVETWLKHQEKKTDYHLIYPEMEKDLEEYRNETDFFGRFAEDCLLFEPEAFLPDIALKAVASAWATDTGEKAFLDPTPKYIKKVIENYVTNRSIQHPVQGGVQHRVDRTLYDIDPGAHNILRGFVGLKLSSTGEGYFKRARRDINRQTLANAFGS